jgi:hypothetical protein
VRLVVMAVAEVASKSVCEPWQGQSKLTHHLAACSGVWPTDGLWAGISSMSASRVIELSFELEWELFAWWPLALLPDNVRPRECLRLNVDFL